MERYFKAKQLTKKYKMQTTDVENMWFRFYLDIKWKKKGKVSNKFKIINRFGLDYSYLISEMP